MPTLHLHGTPRLTGTPVGDVLLSAREAALLAWLHLEGATPRARIAGLLWPASSEAQARGNLRQTLARLKRATGDVLGEVLADAEGQLALPPGAAVAPPAGQPLLGPLVYDDAPEFAEWLQRRRDEALRRHQRETLAEAEAALARGELDAVLAAADAVLATHPESEEAWRLRMQAFQRRGDRASALQAWDDCRLAVRAAFGVPPSAATQALGQRILADEEVAPQGAAGLPTVLRRPPQLLGREEALATLQRGLALGQGAVLLGPGGIGKSRLLAEVLQRHGPGLSTGARPGDAQQPGALLARLVAAALRRFEPALSAAVMADLAHLLPPAPGQAAPQDLKSALEHRRVLAAVTLLLQACFQLPDGRAMRLVVVDDLHHADDASLEALQVIVGAWLARAPDAAAPPLLAARPEELSAAAVQLFDLLGRSGRAARLELPPLPLPQVQRLVHSVVAGLGADQAQPEALAEALHTQVGGNPAFVLEALKSLCLDGAAGLAAWAPGRPLPTPAPLLEAVRHRLQRLSADALQMAQLAAVAESDFSLALAAAAFGRPLLALAPLLQELQAAQVFDGQSFGHDLVAEAVRSSVPAALKAALHGLVAQQLMASAGAPGRIAHHLQAAGEAHAAVHWHLQAAQTARARWQMADAASAYAAAARALTRPAERAAALDACCEAARCALWANREALARTVLDSAAPLARAPAERARVLALHTAWLFNTRQLGEGLAAAARLMSALEDTLTTLPAADLVYGLRALNSLVPHGVDVARTLALASRVQAHIGPAGEGSAMLRTVRGGLLQWSLRLHEAADELGTAWALTADGSDPGQRVMVGNVLMRVLHALGDLPAARAVAMDLVEEAQALQLGVRVQTDVLHVLAMMEMGAGEPVAALARLATVLQRLEQAGEAVPDAFFIALALAHLAVGRDDAAQAWLERHPARGQQGYTLPDVAWTLTRAKLACWRGQDPMPWLAQVQGLEALPPALQLQCEVALATLRPVAAAHFEALAALALRLQGLGLRGLQRSIEAVAARAALQAGHAAAATVHARRALALAAHVDAWIDEPATVWLMAAEVLQATGQAEEAAAAAATGAAWVQARAAPWPDEAARHAWCEGHPVHRALLKRAVTGTGTGKG